MCRKCHVSNSGAHADRWNTYGKIIKITDRFQSGASEDRAALWDRVDGNRVLEVGVGPGRSMPYYPRDAELTAVDISASMLDIAEQRAETEGLNVDLRQVDAEEMPFEDGHFDCVVTNATLCCTENVRNAIDEIRRVVADDGRYVMVENVRADTEWVATLQEKLKPVFRLLHGGYFYRDTPAILRERGFALGHVETRDRYGMSKLMVATPDGNV